MKKFFLTLIILFFVGCASLPETNGIPNFRTVNAEMAIYRGGQMNTNGLLYLKSIGVSNIIKLDLKSESKASEVEIDAARSMGFCVIYVPMAWKEQLIGPVQKWKVELALKNMIPGTYVHCLHGQDRTGLIVALYKMRQGVSKKDAEKEMLDDGFHKSLHGLWEYFEHTK
jgi:hypothetical protein